VARWIAPGEPWEPPDPPRPGQHPQGRGSAAQRQGPRSPTRLPLQSPPGCPLLLPLRRRQEGEGGAPPHLPAASPGRQVPPPCPCGALCRRLGGEGGAPSLLAASPGRQVPPFYLAGPSWSMQHTPKRPKPPLARICLPRPPGWLLLTLTLGPQGHTGSQGHGLRGQALGEEPAGTASQGCPWPSGCLPACLPGLTASPCAGGATALTPGVQPPLAPPAPSPRRRAPLRWESCLPPQLCQEAAFPVVTTLTSLQPPAGGICVRRRGLVNKARQQHTTRG